MNIDDRVMRARMSLLIHQPFFGTLLMHLPMIKDNGTQTMSTDGKCIRWNEHWTAGLTDLGIRGVIIHEIAHVFLRHMFRLQNREHKRFNIACDFAINEFIDKYTNQMKAAGHPVRFELPPGGCLDYKLSEGRCAEEIYNLLPPNPRGMMAMAGGGGDEDGPVSPGEFTAPPGSPAENEQAERDIEVAVVQAASVARMQGKYPGCVSELVKDLLAPKVPWRDVLRQFMRQRAKEDYSWSRPARRYLHTGFILPGMYSERMGRIVIAYDTSGSITSEILQIFCSEGQAVLDECQPESIQVINCDARIQSVEDFRPGDKITMNMKGRGGTDFRPVFKHVAEAGDEPPVCLIYLTDMMGSFPSVAPEYPVLWAAVDGYRGTPPFGELVAVS